MRAERAFQKHPARAQRRAGQGKTFHGRVNAFHAHKNLLHSVKIRQSWAGDTRALCPAYFDWKFLIKRKPTNYLIKNFF
jgi:hypothetical protein